MRREKREVFFAFCFCVLCFVFEKKKEKLEVFPAPGSPTTRILKRRFPLTSSSAFIFEWDEKWVSGRIWGRLGGKKKKTKPFQFK